MRHGSPVPTPATGRRPAAPSPRRPLPFLAAALVLAALLAGAARPAGAGQRIRASCDCGYTSALSLFGSRANFRTVCMVPGLCLSSGDMVTFNALDPQAGSRDCPGGNILPYTDPSLAPDAPGQPLTSWNVPGTNLRYVLYQKGYFCPRCHRKTLRFSLAGFFD